MHDSLIYMAKIRCIAGTTQKTDLQRAVRLFRAFLLTISTRMTVCPPGQKSLLDKMPVTTGKSWRSLRLVFSFMWTHPGQTSCLFMGCWSFGSGVEVEIMMPAGWYLLQYG